MHTAEKLYSPLSTADRIIFKDEPFTLTSGESDFDGIPRQLSDPGFINFGMDAIGLNNKVWEQEIHFDVKQMYEILDVEDPST